jgi:hypothetical protein
MHDKIMATIPGTTYISQRKLLGGRVTNVASFGMSCFIGMLLIKDE